ncbi:MAG TPA: monovalent cation/H(+) antiporter subunit G [Steroidobacteraceae bacterium]
MSVVLPDWIAIAASVLMILGGLLSLIGSLGLLRLRSFYQRMHPVTMGATLGTGCILVCTMLVSWGIRPLVITLFVVITAPISAVTLMRAAISRTDRG